MSKMQSYKVAKTEKSFLQNEKQEAQQNQLPVVVMHYGLPPKLSMVHAERARNRNADKDWFGILMVVGKSTNKRRRYIRQMSAPLLWHLKPP